MTSVSPRSGYTLPVFACAAAIAALRWLSESESLTVVSVDLIEPAKTVEIPIEQVAGIKAGAALAITRSEPGENLDLTRNTPLWAIVEWSASAQGERINVQGGEGVGKLQSTANATQEQAAIYAYARRLLQVNLERWLQPEAKIQVTIILPEGRTLAKRTSNEAFGVVEGLSLLGTSGIAQPLSAPQQLQLFQTELRQKAADSHCLVFCLGENGLDLGQSLGIKRTELVKTANWLGPMLVEASLQKIPAILLLGYHGKLIKLAGGIFHTHHHIADGRQEILTAHCANLGLPRADLQQVFASPTTEAALQYLRHLDTATGSHWVEQVYGEISQQIDQRSQAYILKHSDRSVTMGSALFDRSRKIFAISSTGATLLKQVLLP